jgi:plastocyanin
MLPLLFAEPSPWKAPMKEVIHMIRSVSSVSVLVIATVLGFYSTSEATVRNINIGDFFFSPTHTVANLGDTIQWTFTDGVHTTTSDGASPKSWNSGNRSSGTYQIVLGRSDRPGPFPYHCNIHFTMVDTIYISPTHDGDGDGIPDIVDNCPFQANPSQVDSDMDQYGSACDCDDNQTGVHPGALEIVDDGIDQDCNGFDAVTCFRDVDHDGFGSATMVVATDGSCDVAQSESVVGADCNDNNLSIHPGATEIVDDGIDQDCNGFDAVTCFVDADKDGFGTSLGTTVVANDGTCDVAASESTVKTDCNDTNAGIHPGAAEVPNDGIDQDCNGSDLTGSCCSLRVGDVNGSGSDEPTIGDVSVLIDAKFISGTCTGTIGCLNEADINQSGGFAPTCNDITIGDISALIDYLFITGPTRGLANCL